MKGERGWKIRWEPYRLSVPRWDPGSVGEASRVSAEQSSDGYQASWPHVLLVLKGERGEVPPRSLAEQGFESSRAWSSECTVSLRSFSC